MAQSAALEFDHFIGINPIPLGAVFHPNGKNYLFAAGGNVVVGDLTDPHSQDFLRKHDDIITCLRLSRSGRFVGSGQTGSNSDAVIWSFDRREIMFICEEHDHAVQSIDFSEDEKIVATLGDTNDCKLLFWDMSNGMIIASSNKVPLGTNCCSFNGKVRDIKRRDTEHYLFCTAGKDGVMMWDLDPFTGELIPYRLVGDSRATLTREITAISFSEDRESVYAASTTGDFLVGSLRSQKMVHAVQATKLGLRAILALPGGRGILLGCGDDSVKLFDSCFELKKQVKMDGAVLGLDLSADGLEVLAMTTKGTVNRVNLATLEYFSLSEAHTDSITCITFSLSRGDRFATGSKDGTIRVWDLAEYAVTGSVAPRKEADAGIYRFYPLCLSYADIIISGWSDGKILAHNEDGASLWQIDAAHPEAVSCLTLSHNRRFLLTGGPQGEVRMWELRTRDLISNLKEHKSKVTCIRLTADDSTAITSSRDRCILQWDLREEKRVFCQMQRMGGINAIALTPDQRTIVSVGQERTLSFWGRETLDVLHKQFLDGTDIGDTDEGLTLVL